MNHTEEIHHLTSENCPSLKKSRGHQRGLIKLLNYGHSTCPHRVYCDADKINEMRRKVYKAGIFCQARKTKSKAHFFISRISAIRTFFFFCSEKVLLDLYCLIDQKRLFPNIMRYNHLLIFT
jgi:hypothetical protein